MLFHPQNCTCIYCQMEKGFKECFELEIEEAKVYQNIEEEVYLKWSPNNGNYSTTIGA